MDIYFPTGEMNSRSVGVKGDPVAKVPCADEVLEYLVSAIMHELLYSVYFAVLQLLFTVCPVNKRTKL